MTTTTKTKPISFADFLEQTERKQTSGADSTPDVFSVPDTESIPDVNTASGVKNQPEPVQKVWDAHTASHTESASVKGHLRLPNEVLYRIFPTLKTSEAIVLLRLYALSHGFHKDVCTVSLDTLANGCNLSRTQTRVCVRSLERKGLTKSLGVDNINSRKDLRGITIQVLLPSASRADSTRDAKTASDAKSTPIKEIHIKETHTNTDGVRVGSQFSLKECQQYAEHLHSTGKGINNPGGYATKIYRSGEADDFISTFLMPTELIPTIDSSQCPNCHGTGFWEPSGKGKGVARCKHELLKRS